VLLPKQSGAVKDKLRQNEKKSARQCRADERAVFSTRD
jgi:hypothetical protein